MSLELTYTPETNIFAGENGWLEDDAASFWGKFGLFSGVNYSSS